MVVSAPVKPGQSAIQPAKPSAAPLRGRGLVVVPKGAQCRPKTVLSIDGGGMRGIIPGEGGPVRPGCDCDLHSVCVARPASAVVVRA